MLQSTFILSLLTAAVSGALTDSSLAKHVNSLKLSASFNPIKEAYWTGLPHHRRTPFALSPDGKSAYLAYLDASETDVHVQQVDPSTFAAIGTAVTVTGGKEAGGLVAHNDGFALLTNEAMPSGTSNAPPSSTPVTVLYRYTSGKQSWKTYLGGPDVKADMGHLATPDINGDLVYSEKAAMYGAYFVVTAYDGSASGHFGDSIQYVKDDGTLQTIAGATSTWGCSHNTGIAFEAADEAPFASLCAEDQGEIWLNTKTQGMGNNGVKVSNENVTNGASNEAMGGMSGSYSGLARFVDSDSYIFTWVSRGAKDLTLNDWMGQGYTHAANRTVNRNVAIAQFSDKYTLVGEQATSEVGAADGDSQVNWITTGSADCSNAHVATFDGSNALVTWEEIASPTCDFIAMGCKGAFTGAYYQLVSDGKKVGEPVKATDVYVAGDMVTMNDGRICWPYVDMDWKLDGPARGTSVTEMSFACMGLDGSGNTTSPAAPSTPAASSTPVASVPVSSAAQASLAAPTSVVQDAASSGTPAEIPAASNIPASSAVVSSAPSSAASPEETALPSFDLASSGAPITPPAASSSAAPAISSEIPVSSAPSVPSEAPASEATPSSTILPIASETPTSSEGLCSDAVTTTIREVVTVTVPAGSDASPSSAALPTEVPTGLAASSGFGGPRPSGAPFPSGIYGQPRPSGAPFPSGFPAPSGFRHKHHGHHGYHSLGSRPTGYPTFGRGPSAAAVQTPCSFETRVKPTPTAA